jgi:hypothetical protein
MEAIPDICDVVYVGSAQADTEERAREDTHCVVVISM